MNATRSQDGSVPEVRSPVVVVSAGGRAGAIGDEGNAARVCAERFAPLLCRWGEVVEVTRPESRVDYKLWRLRRQGRAAIHLSFLPPHLTYLTQLAPNVLFLPWEFPDIPDLDLQDNPRCNWARILRQCDTVLTPTVAGRDALLRAGVRAPVHIVPVPVRADYFDVPDWRPGNSRVVDCPCYVFPQPDAPAVVGNPWAPADLSEMGWKQAARHVYKSYVRPRLPNRLARSVSLAVRALAAAHQGVPRTARVRVPYPEAPRLELAGVVYTTVCNPADPCKNWHDLLSAFLLTLGDCEDATLVMKLAVPEGQAGLLLTEVLNYYKRFRRRHRCKLMFVTRYLTDEQMRELMHGTTYYLSASHAAASCQPLVGALAAGRPGVAPIHSGFGDYFDERVGFPVAADVEPCSWPFDPQQQITTSWHRLVWRSLCDQLRRSYETALRYESRYHELAARARRRAVEHAGAESVWPKLAPALDAVARRDHDESTRAAA